MVLLMFQYILIYFDIIFIGGTMKEELTLIDDFNLNEETKNLLMIPIPFLMRVMKLNY